MLKSKAMTLIPHSPKRVMIAVLAATPVVVLKMVVRPLMTMNLHHLATTSNSHIKNQSMNYYESGI